MDDNLPRRLPVYLLDAGTARVDVDGPALRVEHAERAPARYPVSRIHRVISQARHHWSASATRLCLEHRLPVIFVDEAGDLLGSLQPARSRNEPLGDAVGRLAWEPGGGERLDNWVRNEHLRRIHAHADTERDRGARELARRLGAPAPDGPRARSRPEATVHAAMRGLAEALLQDRGLDTRYPLPGGGWWDLAGRLAGFGVLEWQLTTGALVEQGRLEAEVALDFLHRHIADRESGMVKALDRLEQVAREAGQAWP